MRHGGIAAASLAALLLCAAPAATPAAAGERIDRAGQALTASPLYVEPEAAAVLAPADQTALTERLTAANTPIYVAVLAGATLEEVGGDPTQLTAELQRAAGDRPGTYAVLVGETFAAGSTVIGRQAAAIADGVSSRVSDPAQRVIQFADEVELAVIRPPTGVPIEPGVFRERASGVPIQWVIVGLVALSVGWWYVGRRRRRHQDRDDLRGLRATIDEDITSYGAALRTLDRDLRVSSTDPIATADFGHAHAAYERAKQAATGVHSLAGARAVTAALEEGWYSLACARAHRSGHPSPERRPPCLFDPRHGPAASEVSWAPANADVRTVPACQADAVRLAAGHDPDARIVRFADGHRPYWDTGASYAPWAEGWYAAHNPLLLSSLLWGTPLGDVWDDPAMATADSPFDGWSEAG